MTVYFRRKQRFLFSEIFLVIIFVAANCQINSVSASSIESLAQEGLLKSQNMASSEESGNNIPNYSKENADIHANDVDQMDDAEMKSKSHQKMQSADSNSPEGITRDSMNKKTIEGYENQEIFTKAENINDDPIAAFERMTSEGCKEKENEQRQQYKKVVKKEKVTDTEIYEETCEKPAGKINCEKTLNVSCEATEECQAGGIVLGSVESGVLWEYNYPNIRFGTKEGAWKFFCNDSCPHEYCCKKVVMPVKFRLRDISEIRTFRLNKVAFDDHAMVKINGTMVYNSWDGYKLDISNECGGMHDVRVDAGYGKGGVCFQFYGANHYRNVSVDLRSYLREGMNEIEMTLVYAQLGQFNIEIEARQQCCTKLTDKWEKRCWSE
jgi:hypothetical protein